MADKPDNLEQEAMQFAEDLRSQASEWQQKLDDPATKQLIEDGTLQVDPLLKSMLVAFPPVKQK